MKINKNSSTGREAQRTDFVESLYSGLRKKAVSALINHEKLISLASSFIQDGLEQDECVELLMIDGNISREAAQSYVNLVSNEVEEEESNGLHEYNFQFEDESGSVLSSYDINRTVRASTDEEAWEKAESILQTIEAAELLKVNRIS